MLLTKEINWFNRAACGPKNDVYLFWKSFLTLQDKDLLQKDIISQSQNAGDNGDIKSSSSSDPILMYILGLEKAVPSFDAIVRFYEKEAENHQDGLPFVDICLYLNKICDAKKFAVEHHLDYNISVLNRNNDQDTLTPYEDECSEIWMQVLEQRSEVPYEQLVNSAELLGFALRFASGDKMKVITEMAGRGYLWDSFILMSLFYPADETTKHLKAAVWKLYELTWTEELNSSAPNGDQIAHLLEVGLKPAFCYEQIKRQLINHIQNEFLRSALYTDIRVCLMSSVCGDEGDLAYFEMAKDFLHFALTESTILAEFLPAMQKNYFEQAFVVMSDLVKAVLHLCNVSKVGLIEDYGADPQGIIHSIVAGWVDLQVLPQDETSLIRTMKGIQDILYSFIGDIADCTKIPVLGVDCKEFVLLALRVGEVMFNSKLGDRNDSVIFDIVKSNADCHEFIQKLLHRTSDISLNSPLIDKMLLSVRKTLLSVQKLVESHDAITGSANEATASKSFLSPAVPVESCEAICSISSEACHVTINNEVTSMITRHFDTTSITTESDVSLLHKAATDAPSPSIHKEDHDSGSLHTNKTYLSRKKAFQYPPTNVSNAKTALDMMFEEALSAKKDVAQKEVASTSQNIFVVDEEGTASLVNCSSSQSTINDWPVSSQSTDSGKEASVSESSHSSTNRSNVKKMNMFSSNFDNESTNIWSSDKNVRKYNHGNGFAGPLGKVSGGFGGLNGDCHTPKEGFSESVPHVPYVNRGRGGFRRGSYAGRTADGSSGFASDSGYVPRGYQRRGAYVPRGNRGGFS